MDRFEVNVPGSTSKTFYADETATASTTSVTVTVVNAIGTTLATSAATTGTNPYAYAITGFSAPDLLSLSWSGTISSLARVEASKVEIVGGRYFQLGELRGAESQIQSTTDYPTARLTVARDRAETRLEECMGRSFVSRVAVERHVGKGCHLRLRRPHVTSIRQVKIDGTVADASTYNLQGSEFVPQLYRPAGWDSWTDTDAIIEVVYVHGTGTVPDDVKWAAMKLTAFYAQRSGLPGTSIVDRAIGRFEDPSGGSYGISTAGPGRVGIPEVDAIIADRRLVVFG